MYIILIRMNNDELVTIVNSDYTHYEEHIAEFKTHDEAAEAMDSHPLRVFDYQIVEVLI